ncbi:MAG: LysR substrate-binding domain-containing protein, partial [Casimicrobium sp.]
VGATDRLVDIELENIDVAIRYLRHDSIPHDAELLLDELLYPIVSPTYLESAPPLRSIGDLKKHTLIECKWGGLAEQPAQWSRFLEALGETNVRGRSQLKFDFIVQALMAAQGGQGVALARTYGADMLMNGQVVRALDVSVASATGCYLVVSPRGAARPEVRAFVDWLRAEVQKFSQELSAWLARTGNAPIDTKRPFARAKK